LHLSSQFSHHKRVIADNSFFFASTMTRLRKTKVEQGCGSTKPYILNLQVAQLTGSQQRLETQDQADADPGLPQKIRSSGKS
jgi:hypothetical protein